MAGIICYSEEVFDVHSALHGIGKPFLVFEIDTVLLGSSGL